MQFAISSVFSQQNSVSLCPAKFACYSRCFLTSYFCIPVPYNEKGILLGCYFQKVLQVFVELFNFSFFSITGQDRDLDYGDIEWFALEMNRDHSVGGICNFLGSVLLQQKFEAMDRPVLQCCVTTPFYLESKGKYILKALGCADRKDAKSRQSPGSVLAPLVT